MGRLSRAEVAGIFTTEHSFHIQDTKGCSHTPPDSCKALFYFRFFHCKSMKGTPLLKQRKLDQFFYQTDRAITPTKRVNEVQCSASPTLPLDDSHEQSQDDSDSELPKQRRVRRKYKLALEEDDSDNDLAMLPTGNTDSGSSDEGAVRAQPKACQGRRLVNKQMEMDEEGSQIAEDLDFLNENDIYKERTRGKQVSQFSLRLRILKDRKGRVESYNDSPGPIDKYQINPAGNAWINQESGEEGEEEEEEEEEEDIQDFVVDDDMIDGGRVNNTAITAKVELPAEFSSERMQPLSYNFKIYVEYLVYQCQNSSEVQERPSNYFQTAIRAVENRVDGYLHSLLTSDAWRPRYKNALDTHPVWRNLGSGTFTEQCEGCRSNRLSSCKIFLTGGDTDETDEDAGEICFCLGSECRWRGNVYHRLAHFRTHMQDKVREEIQCAKDTMSGSASGEDGPFLIDDILQRLMAAGVIDKLYDGVLELFEAAEGKYVSE